VLAFSPFFATDAAAKAAARDARDPVRARPSPSVPVVMLFVDSNAA